MDDDKNECKHCCNCDYCYTNETMNNIEICVNGNSEYFTDFLGCFQEACTEYKNKYEI